MSSNWKNTLKLLPGFLLRAIIVMAILMPIAYLLSLPLDILFFVIISLIGLWEKRKKLPSILKRSRVIIGVLLGTALFFGFLFWFINNNIVLGLSFFLLIAAMVMLSFGFYDDIRDVKQRDKLKDSLFLVEEETLPPEEQQKCPKCAAVISRNTERCSWCGTNL